MKKAKSDIRKRTQRNIKIMSRNTGGKFLRFKFEEILEDPLATAERIAAFLERDMDTQRMASVVVKRPPGCLPNLAEFPPGYKFPPFFRRP
jgi:hypothetical protein